MKQTENRLDISIRKFTSDDHARAKIIANRAFPTTQSRFVLPGKAGGMVATINGEVAAMSLVRVFRLPFGGRVGMIAWLMTDPDFRGKGLASRLVNASTDYLRNQGCSEVVTDIEGYNTSSANVFHSAGYRRIGCWQQMQRWNPLDLIWLWIQTRLAVDPGYFLWADGVDSPRAGSWHGHLGAVLLNSFLALLALSLGGGLFLAGNAGMPDILQVLATLIGVTILLASREITMRLTALINRQPLEFRAWEGGWGISLIIALCFGRTMPLPGNLYPKGDGWRTRDYTKTLGQAAVANALVLVCIVLGASLVRERMTGEFLEQAMLILIFVGKPLLLFDTLVAIAPFEGFNARHLRDYSRPAWLALAALAVVVFVWG